jgi:hypothetical protein
LAGCGKTSKNTQNGSTQATTPETSAQGEVPDVGSLIGGTGKLSDYDAATRQQMIDEAKAEGGDLEFKSDGSVVYTDPDGSKVIQNADGTWTWEDENGGQGQMGGNWPDNEFTKLLPKPDFALTAANTSDTEFSVAFTGVTVEQVKAYAEQVKSKGFTVNPNEQDQDIMGIVVYTYNAKNADGYTVEVTFAAGTTGMTLRKP